MSATVPKPQKASPEVNFGARPSRVTPHGNSGASYPNASGRDYMPTDYQRSRLWKRTLGQSSHPEFQNEINRLREQYISFRENVLPLAEEIKVSMPMFTDHGIEHIDSLWDTASRLIDEDFPINPAEAFVLGGAFLLHDLGMGLASYQGGISDVETDPLYIDLVALATDTTSTSSQSDPEAAKLDATIAVLRQRHAAQAHRLLNQPFKSDSDKEIYLLADEVLLSAFGNDISSIAQSHWWDVDELSKLGESHGINPLFPDVWEVDPVKLACMLRLADATHIDSRRAPLYLHAFRPQVGTSRDHWYFQQRMNVPKVDKGRMKFTSSQAFGEHESRAWWLAHDTLKMIDHELREVDSLCVDTDRHQFLASGVAGVSTPKRLSDLVRVQGWQPIDASLRVTEVESVIERLGGKHLYGNDLWVPIRELIANAADASTAAHLASGEPKSAIHVRMYQEAGRYWLEVQDHGIGMASESLVNSLTDFGHSRWRDTAIQENPGITAQGFRSRGRFGIGFFSVFMLADRVEVTSLRYQLGATETASIVFEDGLKARPLIREVPPRERLPQHGTRIRARLKHDPLSDDGLFGTVAVQESRSQMLRDMIEERCALLDTDVLCAGPEDELEIKLVSADEWKTCSASDLFHRVYRSESRDPLSQQMYGAWERVFVEHEQELFDERGEVVGRAVLAAGLESDALSDVWWWPSPTAYTYVGGLYSDLIFNCLGVFVGEPLKADRNSAFPVASTNELKRWASSQAELTSKSRYATSQTRYGAADLARSVGETAPYLPCGYTSSGELLASQLGDWVGSRDEVLLIPTYELLVFHEEDGGIAYLDRTRGRRVLLPENAVVLDFYAHWFFPEEVLKRPKDSRFGEYGPLNATDWNPKHWWYVNGRIGSASLVLEAILAAWMITPEEVTQNFHRHAYGETGDHRLGLKCADADGSVRIDGYSLRRPS
jgi:hypothetical protein